MSAAVAEAAIANTEQTEAPAAAPAKPKAVPAPKPEAKDEPEKPKAKPAPVAAEPVDKRESNVQKFARQMNAQAEKDGVTVDAPPEERRAKPGPKPGSKREPKPEAATAEPVETAPKLTPSKPEPAADDTATQEASSADADDDDTGKPEPRREHQLKAKARLRHGDVDKAIRIAFGDLRPEEFDGAKEALAKKLGVGSKQWADFRRFTAAETAKAKQLETNAIQLSQRLQADFTPLIEAKKAYKSGDYPKAFELAFGEDINTFNRKAIHQKLSQDPEKVRMQQQIEELRAKVEQRAPAQPAEPAPEQQHAAALQREGDRTHLALLKSDDPEIAHFAKKARFIHRVVEIRGEHYDPQSRTTLSLAVAADMARNEINAERDSWRYDSPTGEGAPNSELPGQAGNEPVRTSHRARSPLPSQAAQAGGSTRSMSRDERIRAFASRMG